MSIDAAGSPPVLIVSIENIEYTPFLQVLEEGLSSEIVYTVRMRNKNVSGALTNSSGRKNWTMTKTASKEYLTNMYLLETNGTESAFMNRGSFIEDFFSCRTPVPEEFFSSDDYLLEAKASVDLIKRPVPLSLLDPFIRSEITETGWFRFGD